MASLDTSLREHICHSLRPVAIENLWGPPSSHLILPRGKGNLEAFYDTYFRYYAQQCDLIGRHAKGRHSSIETHKDIIEIAILLQKRLNREEVLTRMSCFLKATDREQHENSINLVARLLLMIKFGDLPHELHGGRHLEWSYGSLPEFIQYYFSRPPARNHERIKLEKSFNALNLKRVGGIEIWWTDNLADHLRMMNDDKAVAVFYHASFLEYQLDNVGSSSIFPVDFIEETLRTIALLFPKYDTSTREWYKRTASNSACPLDMRLIEAGNLNAERRQIDNFRYWHDRLVILKEVYDEARPSTLCQWWFDRRNGVQWSTFWVALWVLILTIIFGLFQCILTALQVYKAFRP